MPASDLARAALQIANTQVGVTEHPPGSNTGPEVNAYLASVGAKPGLPWCASFASWAIQKAASDNGITPKFKSSASAQAIYFKNPDLAIEPEDLQPDDLPCLFVHKHPDGKGHVGFVAGLREDTGQLVTIEGNSDKTGSRTGGSVVLLDTRTINDPKLLGFVRII